jgi:hypothetical protein
MTARKGGPFAVKQLLDEAAEAGDWIRALHLLSASLDLRCVHATSFVSPLVTETVFGNVPASLAERAMLLVERSAASVRHSTRVQQLMGFCLLCRVRREVSISSSSSIVDYGEEEGCKAELVQPPGVSAPPTAGSKNSSRTSTMNNATSAGGVTLSWKLACRVFAVSMQGCNLADPRSVLPQRNMQEILRHSVFNLHWAQALYHIYKQLPYETVQGPHAYLSMMRCAKHHRDGDFAIRVMKDFLSAYDAAPASFSKPGVRLLWTGFSKCSARPPGDVERVADAMRRRGLLDDVDEARLQHVALKAKCKKK